MNTTAKPEFVRSSFRSRWRGLVLDREKRKGAGALLTIVILVDQHGNRMRRRILTRLDEHWTTRCEPIDLSQVNPDWLVPPA